MQEIEYITKPQGPILEKYLDCRDPVSLIIGPLGSGKTIVTCNKLFDLMCEQEPVKDKEHKNYNCRLSRIIAVRNTYSDLSTTTIKDWRECHDEFGLFKQGGREPPQQKLDFLLNDGTRVVCEILFIAFDRPDHVRKARGLQATWVWLNEIKELSKAVVDILDLRIGRYPSRKEGATPTHYGMVGDSNAPDDVHWLYKLAEEERPTGWTVYKQPGGVIKNDAGDWVPNPKAENLKNLPPDYYTRGMSGKSNDWIKVNLGNEYGFVIEGKPVHPRYVDSVHCKDINWKPSPLLPIILGFDFGRTPCVVLMQKGELNRWYVFDEMTSEDMSAASFAPELKKYLDENYPNFKFRGWGDPSGGKEGEATDDTAHKIVRAAGIPCVPPVFIGRSNNAAERRQALEFPMKDTAMDARPRFVILPKCKMVRRGLMGGFCYRRVNVSGEKYTDTPDKNMYSHPVEALEYGLLGEGEGRGALRRDQKTPSHSVQADISFNPMNVGRPTTPQADTNFNPMDF